MNFDKKDTLSLKGLAILAMLFHHCFLSYSRFEGYDISFFPFSANYGVDIARALKICVPTFAFISGYGLWKSYEVKKVSTGRWLYQRWLKTFCGYWLIFILSLLVLGLMKSERVTNFFQDGKVHGLVDLALNFFGLNSLFGTSSISGTWWYMGLALLIIAMVPLFYHMAKKIGSLPMYLVVLLFPLALCLGAPDGAKPLSFIGAAAAGMWMADLGQRKDLLTLGDGKTVTRVLACVCGIFLVALYFVVFCSLTKAPYWILMYDVMPIPVIWFCLKYLVKIPGLKLVLQFLGKHSMNIFLVHTFLRTDSHIQAFLLNLKYAPLIVLVLLVMSLVISLAIEGLKKLTHWNQLFDRLGRIGVKQEAAS